MNLPEGLDRRFLGKYVIKQKEVDTKMDNPLI